MRDSCTPSSTGRIHCARSWGGGAGTARWLLSWTPLLSVLVSLVVHAAMLTVCVTTAMRATRKATDPEILLPKGLATVEFRTVRSAPRFTVTEHRLPAEVPPLRPGLVFEQPQPRPIDPAEMDEPQLVPPAPLEPLPEVTLDDTDFLDRRPQPLPAEPPSSDPEVTPVPAPRPAEAQGVVTTDDAEPEPTPAATPPEEAAPPPAVKRGVETGAEIVHLPTPRYPPSCRRRGEEGLVLLEIEVLIDGKVGEIVVLEHADSPALDSAAVDAARDARFRPATRDGLPVPATVVIPFRFELR